MHKNKFINRSLYAVLTVGVSSTLFSCQNDMHEDIAGKESDIVSFCIDKSSWGDASDTRSDSGKGMREIIAQYFVHLKATIPSAYGLLRATV